MNNILRNILWVLTWLEILLLAPCLFILYLKAILWFASRVGL